MIIIIIINAVGWYQRFIVVVYFAEAIVVRVAEFMSAFAGNYGSVPPGRFNVSTRIVSSDSSDGVSTTSSRTTGWSRSCRKRNFGLIALLLLLAYITLGIILVLAFYIHKYDPALSHHKNNASLTSSTTSVLGPKSERQWQDDPRRPLLLQMIVSRTVRKPAIHLVAPTGCQIFMTIRMHPFRFWGEDTGTSEFSLSRGGYLSSSVEGWYFVYVSVMLYNHPVAGRMPKYPSVFVGTRTYDQLDGEGGLRKRKPISFTRVGVAVTGRVQCKVFCLLRINLITYLYRNQSIYVSSFDGDMAVRMCPDRTYFGALLLNTRRKAGRSKTFKPYYYHFTTPPFKVNTTSIVNKVDGGDDKNVDWMRENNKTRRGG